MQIHRIERGIFDNIHYVVDRLHITGHKGEDCKKYCHPNLFPEIKSINSVICESVNFKLSGYKYSVKHMNVYRFNFFLFLLCDTMNKLNMSNRIDLQNEILGPAVKRKRNAEMDDESD